MTMEKESWRKTILDALCEEGEVSADTLHEGADGEDELKAAIFAAEALVVEGLVEEKGGVYAVPQGKRRAVLEAAAAAR